jgi:hypothetical protein
MDPDFQKRILRAELYVENLGVVRAMMGAMFPQAPLERRSSARRVLIALNSDYTRKGQLYVRTIRFATGSALVLFERPTNFQVPGQSYHEPVQSFGNPFSVTLTDTVDGADSTGMFAGSSGTLTGEVKVAGAMAIITLSGPIALA